MHPILFNIGRYNLYMYALLLTIAYVVGLTWGARRAIARGLDEKRTLTVTIYVLFAAVIGAKLLFVLTHVDDIVRDPGSIVRFAAAGGVFFGGLIAVIGAVVWYSWRVGISPFLVGDASTPPLALAHVIGRFGCWFAGCCYGKPTDVPWGVTFTNLWAPQYAGTPLDVPLHPTQLYDAGAEAIILLVLLKMERRGRGFTGRTFWLYILLYAVSRFAIEFFRGDLRGHVGAFSTSQFIALLLAPLAVGMLVYLGRLARTPDPLRASPA